MYLLWRCWGNIHVATLGCLFWFFMPASWWAGIYGMPHLPGLLCFLTSLYFFQRATMSLRADLWGWAILSMFMAAMAVCWKTDMILYCPVFLGVALISSKNRIFYLMAILIPVVSLIVVLTLCHLLIASDTEFGTYTSNWNKNFPFTLTAWLNWHHNILILIRTCGKYMLGMAILAWFYCAAQAKYRKWAILALMWAGPGVVFWGSKTANSARHMLAAFSVLTFILAIAMVKVCKKPAIAYVSAILLIAINYFGTAATADTVKPSGRLFESAILQQQRLDWLYDKSMELLALPYAKIYLVGGITNPYMEASFLDGREQIDVKMMAAWPQGYVVIDEKGKERSLRTQYSLKRPLTFGPVEGWYCWTCENGITIKNNFVHAGLQDGK
jgi:hypothetical protein